MAKVHRGRGRLKKEQNSVRLKAHDRGIYAIRRVIDGDSISVFEKITENLTPEFRGQDRLFTPKTLMVTVVGFGRFSQHLKNQGPSSKEIIEGIDSFKSPLKATLGQIGIFGSGNAHKLAFKLHSPELEQEIINCEDVYADLGFRLMNNYHNPDEAYVPHCSIGWIHKSNVGHHDERVNKARYNRLAGALGREVLLALPKPKET